MIRPAAVTLLLVLLVGGLLAACVPGGAGTPKTDFEAKLSRVDESLRVRWTITNTGDRPILVFDRIRSGDGVFDPDAGNGAYVTGRSDGTVEIAMRAFPVPKGTEGVVPYEFTATRLAPGASADGNLIVLLPFRYRPAAPVRGGGDPLPDDPQRAVFCLGVMPADGDRLSGARDPEHPILPHAQWVVDAQTLRCSDPIDLGG